MAGATAAIVGASVGMSVLQSMEARKARKEQNKNATQERIMQAALEMERQKKEKGVRDSERYKRIRFSGPSGDAPGNKGGTLLTGGMGVQAPSSGSQMKSLLGS